MKDVVIFKSGRCGMLSPETEQALQEVRKKKLEKTREIIKSQKEFYPTIYKERASI